MTLPEPLAQICGKGKAAWRICANLHSLPLLVFLNYPRAMPVTRFKFFIKYNFCLLLYISNWLTKNRQWSPERTLKNGPAPHSFKAGAIPKSQMSREILKLNQFK